DYLKSVVPSQLLSERGSNLVVINPGSANIRIGLASKDTPLNIPHSIAWHTTRAQEKCSRPGFMLFRNFTLYLLFRLLNTQVTTTEYMDRQKIATFLKIQFIDKEVANNSYPRKMGRIDGLNPRNSRKDTAFDWTDVYEKEPSLSSALEISENKSTTSEGLSQHEGADTEEPGSGNHKYKNVIYGEEALKISPVSAAYQRRVQAIDYIKLSDTPTLWADIIFTRGLHKFGYRNVRSELTISMSFQIKELLFVVLRDLCFSSAVVHQEGLAAAFGNGLSMACVVKMGAQVTSVICIESWSTTYDNVSLVSSIIHDGAALPNTEKTLPFGGEDISRCLLWTQRHHHTWPQIRTDMFTKLIDLLMRNRLKESYCEIKEGELDAVGVVHSYEDGMPAGSHKTRLTALNVPPMGLFFPMVLVPDAYPPPPSVWCRDYEDMLEDTWHMEFRRRPEMSDSLFPNMNTGYPMWDGYPAFSAKPKKEEKVGLAKAITSSILSTAPLGGLLTGRIDLQRKLFCSILLVGGVASTRGLVPAVEESLHSIVVSEPSSTACESIQQAIVHPRSSPDGPWINKQLPLKICSSSFIQDQALTALGSTNNCLFKI
ncbi:actin-related protein 9, partial [Pyrus ussuriensis x Pyrus communis]